MGYHGANASCMQKDQRPSPAVYCTQAKHSYLRDLKNENAKSYRVRVRLQHVTKIIEVKVVFFTQSKTEITE